MKSLGANQLGVLDALKRHHGWPGGWIWKNESTTIRILESLVARGLVVKKVEQRATGYGNGTISRVSYTAAPCSR